jgi:hypothetical protein
MIARFSAFIVATLVISAPVVAVAQELDLATGQTQTQFIGRAPLACLLSTPTGTQITGATFTTSGTTAQLTFAADTLIDPQSALARAFSMSLTVPVLCNSAHTVTVSSVRGGMVPTTSIANVAGFSGRIDLAIGATWAGSTVQANTNGNPLTLTINASDAASGNVEVNLRGIAGTDPMIAGRYNDAIIIALVPSQ